MEEKVSPWTVVAVIIVWFVIFLIVGDSHQTLMLIVGCGVILSLIIYLFTNRKTKPMKKDEVKTLESKIDESRKELEDRMDAIEKKQWMAENPFKFNIFEKVWMPKRGDKVYAVMVIGRHVDEDYKGWCLRGRWKEYKNHYTVIGDDSGQKYIEGQDSLMTEDEKNEALKGKNELEGVIEIDNVTELVNKYWGEKKTKTTK